MKFLLTLLATSLALTRAAPVTVTRTVVVATQYVTYTVNGSPSTQTTVSQSTQSPANPVSSATSSAESTTTASPSVVVITSSSTSSSSSSTEAAQITSSSSTSTSTSSTSTTSTSSSTTSSSLNTFEAAILAEHNAKRALHGANPLTWDTTLAQYAANYAASSFSCDNVQLIHSGGPYGENLAAGYVGGAAPVDAWYDEIQYYDYSNPGFSEATGHFTQVIWASTERLGCAMVTCDNAWSQYTICEYSPAGNVIGYFSENVYPLVS